MGNSPSSESAPSAVPTAPPQQPDGCPVDHSTRLAYLASSSSSSSSSSRTSNNANGPSSPAQLETSRVISSIPRSDSSPALPEDSPSHTNEPIHKDSKGRWIYPSEKMFFEAMRRKSYSPEAKDMSAIVPIHNAVNERAWAEILAWENKSPSAREANQRCGGPRLRSFKGDSTKLTPRARLNSLLGYEKPFDRHDWVVERCGGQGKRAGGKQETLVEYVIDFYKGRDQGGRGGGLNFYLDVRPKLNTWEGWRMRIGRTFGF